MKPVERDPRKGLNGAVAAELRAERAAHSLTNKEIAAAAGLKVVSVQRYLAGTRTVDVEHLEKFAAVFGVRPCDIVERASDRLGRTGAEVTHIATRRTPDPDADMLAQMTPEQQNEVLEARRKSRETRARKPKGQKANGNGN